MSDRLLLLFGGTSEERRVSVASAQNVARVRPDAELWFLAPGGSVHACEARALAAHARPFEDDFHPGPGAAWPSLDAALAAPPADAVFFLALHGGDGENGVLQRQLEERGAAFTGSGSAASALAFDKGRAKEAVAQAGVRVARASVLDGGESAVERALGEAFAERGRLVVKPVASGSSFGLFHVRSLPDVAAAARGVASVGAPFLAEDFVQGVELTVGVVEAPGAEPVALPPSEVRLTPDGAFDYAGKYLGRGVQEITPAEVPAEVVQVAQRSALAAHRQIGCAGYSRTDLIADGTSVTFLEINTLPGLTRASFLPQQLAAAGRTLEGFIADRIALARARQRRR